MGRQALAGEDETTSVPPLTQNQPQVAIMFLRVEYGISYNSGKFEPELAICVQGQIMGRRALAGDDETTCVPSLDAIAARPALMTLSFRRGMNVIFRISPQAKTKLWGGGGGESAPLTLVANLWMGTS